MSLPAAATFQAEPSQCSGNLNVLTLTTREDNGARTLGWVTSQCGKRLYIAYHSLLVSILRKIISQGLLCPWHYSSC